MNFKNKTEIIRFSRHVVFPPVPPLSHFTVRAGMRGRQRIWDSEGKKEEKKEEKIIYVLFLKFISVD
jgi:hypothetical protein